MRAARILSVLVGTAAVGFVLTAAAIDSFRISQLYSNQDGTRQFVELTETAARDSEQDDFANLVLAVTNGRGERKTFTFPANLPTTATANRHVLIATRYVELFGDHTEVVPDFVIPDRFLPTDGGTIELGTIDRWTYGPLPRGGSESLARSGVATRAVATSLSGAAG